MKSLSFAVGSKNRTKVEAVTAVSSGKSLVTVYRTKKHQKHETKTTLFMVEPSKMGSKEQTFKDMNMFKIVFCFSMFKRISAFRTRVACTTAYTQLVCVQFPLRRNVETKSTQTKKSKTEHVDIRHCTSMVVAKLFQETKNDVTKMHRRVFTEVQNVYCCVDA